MGEGRIDLESLAERAEAAINDLRQELERKGLEALVAVGTSAAEALEEMDKEEAEDEGE